ncbi:MAG: response regulator SirA [Cellvibrionaceae bacterium]|nr:response regulator SirA [Cellvibrionaceae bacterium]|tara:strand:+ start:21938 stop:22159 length:222 start_codon:yes stop_codon:yes gene_type:complete
MKEVDARGLSCPLPLLKAKQALNQLNVGEQLRVLATDEGSVRDFKTFAQLSGHLLLSSDEQDGCYIYILQKAS